MASQAGTAAGIMILGIGFLIAVGLLVLGGFGYLLPSIGICAVSGLVGLAVIGASVPKPSTKTETKVSPASTELVQKLRCPTCGTLNRAGLADCADCGEAMPSAKPSGAGKRVPCIGCGAPLDPDEAGCKICGKPARESAESKAKAPPAPPKSVPLDFRPAVFPVKVQVRAVLDGLTPQMGPWVEAEADDQEEWDAALDYLHEEFRKKHQRLRFLGTDLDLRQEGSWAKVRTALRLEKRPE